MFRILSIVFCVGLAAAQTQTTPQTTVARPPRPAPPTRDPNTPGYVTAKALADGVNAPPNVDGNFILGPTHDPAPEMSAHEGVPKGTIYNFTMESSDSKI